MLTGILAGVTWALETVVLGIALGLSPFVSTEEAILLAPFVATFLHDACSAVFMLIYNAARGGLKEFFGVCRSKTAIWLTLSSAIGGPIGMTGYVLAVNYMGASVGAVASAVYPAVGTVLARIFLKERTKWYQWIFLVLTLLGVYGLSYSPAFNAENFWLGLLGAFMCAFGWGIEAVVLAKCLRDTTVRNEHALGIRQAVSALLYGTVILPLAGGWRMTAELFSTGEGTLILTVAVAALCATVSYLLYYKAIGKLGAAKAMALNITYTAWAILFSVILLRDLSMLNPLTLGCAAVIVVCGICAAADMKRLFGKSKETDMGGDI